MSSTIKSQLAAIDGHLATAKLEEIKLAGGCKASAARCRNALLEIGKLCSEIRKDVLDVGKAVPVKKRVPKPLAEEVKPDEVESDGSEPEEKKETQIVAPDVLPAAPPVLVRQDGIATSAPIPIPAKKPRAPRKAKVSA